jgi:hypothetical protein
LSRNPWNRGWLWRQGDDADRTKTNRRDDHPAHVDDKLSSHDEAGAVPSSPCNWGEDPAGEPGSSAVKPSRWPYATSGCDGTAIHICCELGCHDNNEAGDASSCLRNRQ